MMCNCNYCGKILNQFPCNEKFYSNWCVPLSVLPVFFFALAQHCCPWTYDWMTNDLCLSLKHLRICLIIMQRLKTVEVKSELENVRNSSFSLVHKEVASQRIFCYPILKTKNLLPWYGVLHVFSPYRNELQVFLHPQQCILKPEDLLPTIRSVTSVFVLFFRDEFHSSVCLPRSVSSVFPCSVPCSQQPCISTGLTSIRSHNLDYNGGSHVP